MRLSVYGCLAVVLSVLGLASSQGQDLVVDPKTGCILYFPKVAVNMSDPMRWRYPFTTLQWQWWDSLWGFPLEVYFGPEKAAEHLGPKPASPRCERREYRTLSDQERRRYSQAFLALHSSRPDPDSPHSEYDMFVLVHNLRRTPGAHFGAAFLLWHREYLFRMELALQRHDPSVCLAYWASPLDQQLPLVNESAIWTEDYLGNSKGPVTSGMGPGWKVTPECQQRHAHTPGLYRDVNYDGCAGDYLYSFQDVAYVWGKPRYADITWSYDIKFETDHGLTHQSLGGYMLDVQCSPAAPEFWLHHTFIDYVLDGVLRKDKERAYPPNDPDIPYQDAADPMMPFSGVLNEHGLSTHYTDYFYSYAPMPHRCDPASTDNPCGGSPLLWCTDQGTCMAKVRVGGTCGNLPDRACACDSSLTPVCSEGVCLCEDSVAKAISAKLRDIIRDGKQG